jgi:dolichol-phosphate mannosyltransferase
VTEETTANADAPPTLSVVIPMYNEEAVLPLLVERLRPVLDDLAVPYEVVAVDDGSRDNTPLLLLGLRRGWPELRVIRLRRNFGHQAALTAGLHSAFGEYVVSIDADLQDPPETIPRMLDLARRDGLDIVYGVRVDRGTDTFFKRATAGIYYNLMRRVVGDKLPSHAGDFRLLSRATVDALRQLPETTPIYRLLVPWIGFPSGEVSYVRERRAAGSTKYSLSKMVRLAWDSVASFSAAPLRIATWLGVFGFVACAALMLLAFISWLVGMVVPGWASIFVATLFVGAVQLLCLGLLGEYVGRIYAALQGRPTYFISSDSASDHPASAATGATGATADAAERGLSVTR